MEGVVRSFIGMVQSGRDLLVDILLIGWWWGNWESASSAFWFQPVWGLPACGQHALDFSHLVGVSVSAKSSKILFCVSLEGNQDPAPKAALLFPDCSLLSLHPLPSLISNCLNLPVGTQRRSRRLNEANFLQAGNTEKLLCPGTPQGPAGLNTW